MTAKLSFATALSRRARTYWRNDFRFDHWIESTLCQGMAPQHSPDCHYAAPQCPKTIHGFHGVLGARRHVPARWQEEWGDRPFIRSEQKQHDGLGNLIHSVFDLHITPRSEVREIWFLPAHTRTQIPRFVRDANN